jgi:hypothetical protein
MENERVEMNMDKCGMKNGTKILTQELRDGASGLR